MKKYPSFFLRFIAIFTTNNNKSITKRIKNDFSIKYNTLNISTNLVKDLSSLVFFSLAITFFTLIIMGNIKLFSYTFLILLLSSSGKYWLKYGKYNFSSYNEPKKSETIKTPKKPGVATFTKINKYITTEKKYLSHEISLHSIATFFDISKGYTSQLINMHAEKSFNDYINELRVEASQKMLLDKQYDNYTIESIGLECGFSSKSNFYTTFKKISGQTPNQYKKLEK